MQKQRGEKRESIFLKKSFSLTAKCQSQMLQMQLLHTLHSFFLTDSLKSYGVIVQPPQTNTDAHTPYTCSLGSSPLHF